MPKVVVTYRDRSDRPHNIATGARTNPVTFEKARAIFEGAFLVIISEDGTTPWDKKAIPSGLIESVDVLP